MPFDFEMETLLAELKKRKPKRVLVQLPEGIKARTTELIREIAALGIETIVSGESCWGACSIALDEAKAVGADLIVHFGHARFIPSDSPIIYVEIKDNMDLTPLLKKSLTQLEKYKYLGLSFSIQHRHDAEKVKSFYEGHGKSVDLSKMQGFAAYEGHVVGCEYSGLKSIAKDVDCFIVIGNRFHGLGAALALEKPVFLLDVYNDEVKEMTADRARIVKQRAAAIDRAKNAKTIGIIIGLKPGQKFGASERIVGKFKALGIDTILMTMNEVTPDKLTNFTGIDCFIELACPRIAIDDKARYPKPVLTYREALVVLGETSWDNLLQQGFL